MLNCILSPETIDTLVKAGVFDVIKRCSLKSFSDIAYEAGYNLPLYATAALAGASTLMYYYDIFNDKTPAKNTQVDAPSYSVDSEDSVDSVDSDEINNLLPSLKNLR